MYRSLPYKTKQFFFVLIKLSIVVGAFYFIYQKLLNNDSLDFSRFLQLLNENDSFSTKNIIFLIILSCCNWFFEIKKWQYLVSTVKNISFSQALEQSLGALTASLLTPNRIGEYGAKAVYYAKQHRKRIMLINLISNMMQMSVTVILGCIGFVIFYTSYDLNLNHFKISKGLIIIGVISLLSLVGLRQTKYRIKGILIEKVKTFIKKLGVKPFLIGMCYALIRYAIFSFQFYLLLTLFNIELTYLAAMPIITSMYLMASIIPTISVFDVVIKGSIAVYLFGFVGINELTILSIILLMWLLNFALPSVFGSYYVLHFNFVKTKD